MSKCMYCVHFDHTQYLHEKAGTEVIKTYLCLEEGNNLSMRVTKDNESCDKFEERKEEDKKW